MTLSDCSALLHQDVREIANVRLADDLLEQRAGELGEDATFWQKWSWAFMRTFLMDQVMVKVDRATMWMGLEARAPLLDPRVVEYVLRLPDRYKVDAWGGKRMLKELLADRIPCVILERPKHGFGVPVAGWLRNELSKGLYAYADPDFIRTQGLFDPSCVRRMVLQHEHGLTDRRKELWSYFVFQSWYRRWIT